MKTDKDRIPRLHLFLLLFGLGVLAWSGIRPRDGLTWMLEVFPAIIAAVILVATYKRFRLTNLAYVLIWIHAIILMMGGHWTYAEMPMFNWLRDAFELKRNYYDRLGHLAQGFVPAIVARELLLRTSPLRPGKWLFATVVAWCLAISAAYELVEWSSALILGQGADQFLGTQGDPWDTQWDMFCALVGALAGLVLLSRVHDRALDKLLGNARLELPVQGKRKAAESAV